MKAVGLSSIVLILFTVYRNSIIVKCLKKMATAIIAAAVDIWSVKQGTTTAVVD